MLSKIGIRSAGVLVLLLLGSLAAMTAHADMFLAATTSEVPITSFDALTSACAAVQAGSTVQGMYGDGTAIADEVAAMMQNASITQAYVAAWYTPSVGWAWQVTQMGEVAYSRIDGAAFVSGVLPDHTASGSFTVYDTTGKGLVATTGTSPYRVVCYNERLYKEPKKKGFPWWGILIIVLGCVAIVVVVVVVVVCCCKNKKRNFDDADDESSFGSRSTSFSSRGTSYTGSSYTGSTSSGSFSSRGSSYSGSSKSSAVSGSTGSDSYSDGSSSVASSAYTGSTSQGSSSMGSSSRGSSSRGSFSRGSSFTGSSSSRASSSRSSRSTGSSVTDATSASSRSTASSSSTASSRSR